MRSPPRAVALLSAQPQVDKSLYVFPGRDPKHPLRETQRLWHAVRCAAELEGLRLHDLRHSVASFAGGHGYSLFLIGKLLGHKTAYRASRFLFKKAVIEPLLMTDALELRRRKGSFR